MSEVGVPQREIVIIPDKEPVPDVEIPSTPVEIPEEVKVEP